MAAGIMITIAEPFVCETPCNHRDCALSRKMAGTPCATCGEPIESGQRYYRTDKPVPTGTLTVDTFVSGLFEHAYHVEARN